MPEGLSLWSERLVFEDTNMVSKLFCTNLLYVYSYLLSTGVFMFVYEVYRSVIIYRSQVISPGDVLLYIREIHTVIPCLTTVSSTYVWVKKGASLPLMLVRFVFTLNVSEITLNRKLKTSHLTVKCWHKFGSNIILPLHPVNPAMDIMFCLVHQTPLWFWPFFLCPVYNMNSAQLIKCRSRSQNKSVVLVKSAKSLVS